MTVGLAVLGNEFECVLGLLALCRWLPDAKPDGCLKTRRSAGAAARSTSLGEALCSSVVLPAPSDVARAPQVALYLL